MYIEFCEELMFDNLSFYGMKVKKRDIELFKKRALSPELPDEYVFETLEGIFKINKIKKEFRVLKRNYFFDELDMLNHPNKQQIDFQVFMIYRIALRAGFKVYLENKFSN